jgi:cytochrome c oxidase assembly protein subunit 15
MSELVVDRDYFSGSDRAIARWLAAVALLVFAMIVVGGATRLTDSGLSITEWKPIMGAIPPLSNADWERAFEKYKEIPEYHHVNKDMDLVGFKFIFWWEWAHRFLGRFVGLVFAAGLAWFWYKGALRPGLAPKLIGVLGLGALQGALGWYMVSSGLVDRVDVSQYRLAMHLGVAFLILGCLVWLVMELWPRPSEASQANATIAQRWLSRFLVAVIFVQVLLGALVAGLKAGAAYNTWPDMNGALVPSGLFELSPWYLNVFENITTVQFNHRVAALLVLGLAVSLAWSFSTHPWGRLRNSARLVAAAVVLQFALGIWTLLAAVPLHLGLLHQGGAAIVLALAVRHLYLTERVVIHSPGWSDES